MLDVNEITSEDGTSLQEVFDSRILFARRFRSPLIELNNSLHKLSGQQADDATDQRYIAAQAVSAVVSFFAESRIGSPSITDSLATLYGALEAVHRGEKHPLLVASIKKGGRPRVPLDARITQALLKHAVEYLMKNQSTQTNALRQLGKDLHTQHNVKASTKKLSNLLEAEKTATRVQEWGSSRPITTDDEYRNALTTLARPTHLKKLLARK